MCIYEWGIYPGELGWYGTNLRVAFYGLFAATWRIMVSGKKFLAIIKYIYARALLKDDMLEIGSSLASLVQN